MKPLGFSIDAMQAVMRLVETLDGPGAAAARDALGAVLDDAVRRREELTRQVAMADEFIDQLRRLG